MADKRSPGAATLAATLAATSAATPTAPSETPGYAEALDAILKAAPRLSTERVALADAAGRALAGHVVSSAAVPPWDNAGMDGYAVRRADAAHATAARPVRIPVMGTILAGADPASLEPLLAGQAMRIMTGAPMPPGAEAVVRLEDTDGGTRAVEIRNARDLAGRGNVRPRGEDVRVGDTVFAVGTTLGPSHLGVLASIGCSHVTVFRRPRVTIVSSGDELALLDELHEVQAGRRIIASSLYSLPPLLRAAGAEVTVAPLVPDSLLALTEALDAALTSRCDLLVTTGGVSVGAHDFTRDALLRLGGTVSFKRAKIRPGGPVGTGMVRGIPWLGLPGNPVSTMVTATLFAWPMLRALGGHAVPTHPVIPVTMRDAADTSAPLTYFLRVRLQRGADGGMEAVLAGGQGSNLMRAMAMADALLIVPESQSAVKPGDRLDALLLP